MTQIKSHSVRLLLILAGLLLSGCTMMIEPPPPTPEPPMAGTTSIAEGLQSPRQLHYAADGALYIAEAGRAGDGSVQASPENTVETGLTAQISRVSPDGEHSVALPALPSISTSPGNAGFRGSQAIFVTEDSYWVGFGEGPPQSAVFGLPFFRSVVQFDRETWRIGHIIDTGSAAVANNQPDPEAINSDPVDLHVTEDGTVYIVDAGCNCFWSWTESDGLVLEIAWDIDDNPVPTGLAIGPDGDFYISFLSGFPFEVGSARIERYSDGELVQTYGGLTLATDVLVTDEGRILAVQHAAGLGEQGMLPDSGSVVEVTEDGVTPVMEDLRTPYSIAQAPDGTLVVSVISAGDREAQGRVIVVEE